MRMRGVYYTTKDYTIYAICTDCADTKILLQVFKQKDMTITAVELLGAKEDVKWEQTTEGLKLSIPQTAPTPPTPWSTR